MKNYIKELRSKFKKHEIDGYVIPKNDDYFTEYSKINRLKIIVNDYDRTIRNILFDNGTDVVYNSAVSNLYGRKA